MNNHSLRRQQGVSLIIVLILLLIMTLLGLISLRSTLLEERMTANMYDRSLSFQSAERGLREGELLVATGAANLGQNCEDAAVLCPMPNPVDGSIPGCPACWTDAQVPLALDQAPGRPQFYIQRMREVTTNSLLGQGNNAAQLNEGAPGGAVSQAAYRVFARSHDPATAPDRSIVLLQGNLVRR